MRQHYYYVKWANTIRCEQASSPEEACRLAFGMVAENMLVKDIGGRKPAYLPLKKKKDLQENLAGWYPPKIKNQKLNMDI